MSFEKILNTNFLTDTLCGVADLAQVSVSQWQTTVEKKLKKQIKKKWTWYYWYL